MYTFRETVEMGVTGMGEKKVGELLRRLSKEWPGRSYDMLARNCNHFCDEFCQALGVGPTPVWVNRFAYAGDVTLEFYDQASTQLSQFRDSMTQLSTSTYNYLFGPPQTPPLTASASFPAVASAAMNGETRVPVSKSMGVIREPKEGDGSPLLAADGNREGNRASLPVFATVEASSRGSDTLTHRDTLNPPDRNCAVSQANGPVWISQSPIASIICLIAVVLTVVGVVFQPRWAIAISRFFQPAVLFEVDTKEKIVGLTIDDGPNGKFTCETLDILKEHGCSATFFLIGSNIDKYPDLVERMVQDGHEVANHMMADYPGCLLSTKQFMASMLEVDAKLHRFFPLDSHGRQIKWFRPGYGFATPHMQHRALSHGYRLALGSVFPLDPLFKGCGAFLARFCLWKMYPGAIIILHDRPQQGPQTNHILRILLPELKQQGYRIVNLTELVNSVKCKEISQVNGGKQD
ncbi:unnamed protein product [Closterium sp. Yama58-4]|nr:unnamed protein product [Closterium sp. Yama58-4]